MNAQKFVATALLNWKSRPSIVRSAIKAALGTPTPSFDLSDPVLPGSLRVAAVQLQMQLCDTEAFVRTVAGNVRRAAAAGSHIVVFPEYLGAMLLGMLPVARGSDPHASLDPGVKLNDVLALVAPYAARVLHSTFSALAKQHNCYIVTGTSIVAGVANAATDKNLRSRNALYSPHGERVGTQDKLHPFTSEAAWLQPGDSVNVFPIDQLGGKVATSLAMPICMDYTYWETTRIAYQQGAEVLIDSAFDDDAHSNVYSRARGVLMRVQEVPCFGVHCFMVGDFLHYRLRGPSVVVAPWQITSHKDGVLSQAISSTQSELLVTDLDLEALRVLRAERKV